MKNHIFTLSSGFRGFPPGAEPVASTDIASRNWSPVTGEMALPLLSLDLQTFNDNVDAMMSIVKSHGAKIAPHGKTPMSPVLARQMVDSGAWGTSVADLRQAEVMLAGGLNKILLANQIGGHAAVTRLAGLLRKYPKAELLLFVDTPEFIDALEEQYAQEPSLPPLGLLIEISCGRGGVSTEGEFAAMLHRIDSNNDERLTLQGIAFYEGTCMKEDIHETEENLKKLFERVDKSLFLLKEVFGDQENVIISAGGSSLFDYVIEYFTRAREKYPTIQLLLRSGACFFSDNGNIRARLGRIAGRGKLGKESSMIIASFFKPTLRLWAEVISRNGESIAICGLGMRDSSIDQGVPIPLALWRGGNKVADIMDKSQTVKLNDQHAFIDIHEEEFRVGDVIEFGIRHPCTCIDKHDIIYGLNQNVTVTAAYKTFFG
ncbi:alanine racemase [Pantoea cypripedii]|uniref:Amino acid deaminase n=1 Tax=Pantoea cypripedii TaxID=55209 RepID=A0A6B9GCN4_PANCY|nr:alanine racemase [Pantoea cypripedii]QGY33190.1 amino acid deaminase [Pantoea cypripedii]